MNVDLIYCLRAHNLKFSDGRGEEIPQLEVQMFQISGVDPGFFRYICEGTQIFNLVNLIRKT